MGTTILALLLVGAKSICALRLSAGYATPLTPRAHVRRTEVLRLSGGEAPAAFEFQDGAEGIIVKMPIGDDVRSKDVVFELANNVMTFGIQGSVTPIEAEDLWGRVRTDDAFWEIDDVDYPVGDGVEAPTRCVVLELIKRDGGTWEHLLKSQYTPPDTTTTTRAFFDIAIGDEPAGRVEMGLYGKQVRSEVMAIHPCVPCGEVPSSCSLRLPGTEDGRKLSRPLHRRERRRSCGQALAL